LFVILSEEDIVIKGEALSYIETINITNGQENQWFEQFAQEYPRREQTLKCKDLFGENTHLGLFVCNSRTTSQ
jgi:hypothetical protein